MAEQKWFEKVAAKAGMQVNPDSEVVATVLEGLDRNLASLGRRYCPCVPSYAQGPDTICPCLEFRRNRKCHCGLFIPKETP